MTGLNLETFLRLVRVAPGVWISLGVACVLLALLTWTGWGTRRALRKCLVLSIGAHLALIAYGGALPIVQRYLGLIARSKPDRPPVQRIDTTLVPEGPTDSDPSQARPGSSPRAATTYDQADRTLARVDSARPRPPLSRPEPGPAVAPEAPAADRTEAPTLVEPMGNRPDVPVAADPPRLERAEAAPPTVVPPPPTITEADLGTSAPVDPPSPLPVASGPAPSPAFGTIGRRAAVRPRPAPGLSVGVDAAPAPRPAAEAAPPALPIVTPGAAESPTTAPDLGRDLVSPALATPTTPPDQPAVAGALTAPEPAAPAGGAGSTAPVAALAPAVVEPGARGLPDLGGRRRLARAGRPDLSAPPITEVSPPSARPSPADRDAGLLARATPAGASGLPSLSNSVGRRSIAEVPPVYRSRLDPNRSTLAQRAGATPASEQAVERALTWLAAHQDADGRWDGAATGPAGGVADDSFTVHCPPGEVCLGECRYAEADTALTGLALLAYLGAGYTHQSGKHQAVVARGLDFLRQSQRPDGDLRGGNTQVGMYCHAMATLALCEALALTGDPALRPTVERALAFLVESRAVDRMSWRYGPGESYGDTSILGWAVMALKSGRTVGIPIRPDIQDGIERWLARVASGPSRGLASYLPSGLTSDPNDSRVRPTMTAEAWACRQFLELGGPGPRSDEAAAWLLNHPTDGGAFNVYYLYYGTLAMFQHSGPAWVTWNARVRDLIVSKQQTTGHKQGSWDPDDTTYGRYGGRLYCTAMATLTLEVYYRFLPLYTPSGTTGRTATTTTTPTTTATPATPAPPRDPAAQRTRVVPNAPAGPPPGSRPVAPANRPR